MQLHTDKNKGNNVGNGLKAVSAGRVLNPCLSVFIRGFQHLRKSKRQANSESDLPIYLYDKFAVVFCLKAPRFLHDLRKIVEVHRAAPISAPESISGIELVSYSISNHPFEWAIARPLNFHA